jgi:hypothetical protein
MQKNTGKKMSYDILVDNIPYHVDISPFLFNEEKRFIVNINGGIDHLYTWDDEAVQLRALDDEAVILPDGLEKDLSDKIMKTVILK